MSAVKRWHAPLAHIESPTGKFILAEDYLALQAALREALDGWEHGDEDGNEARRVELRKEFLE